MRLYQESQSQSPTHSYAEFLHIIIIVQCSIERKVNLRLRVLIVQYGLFHVQIQQHSQRNDENDRRYKDVAEHKEQFRMRDELSH